MQKASRSFQIFVKPAGALCNLDCSYCYYLQKGDLYAEDNFHPMQDDILERYITQHIQASPDPIIRFSWHGGEPTILGLDYFKRIIEIQKRHRPKKKRVLNGIQTNGTLLTEEWCSFLKKEDFFIGLSLDGPEKIHNRFRRTKEGKPTHEKVIRGYHLLRQSGINPDILCVVNSYNVQYPLEVYRFFRQLGAEYISFLPLVERELKTDDEVSNRTVLADEFGSFLCAVFDEWRERDIAKIKVQIFEEAARTAFEEEHELCIFRKTCGDVPVIEHNGDFYSCDHFVDWQHLLGNINDTPLIDLLENPDQIRFGMNKQTKLSSYCRSCEVLSMCNGECPKNRFIRTPDGEEGLNYLCRGYKKIFNHIKPFIDELRVQWQAQSRVAYTPVIQVQVNPQPKIGRNDPCPCGSGKKYKKCCLGK